VLGRVRGGQPAHLGVISGQVSPPFVVDMDRLNDEGGRALSALGILEAVEACTRASEMVERLDGTCIHDDDWEEEQFILEPECIAGDSDER